MHASEPAGRRRWAVGMGHFILTMVLPATALPTWVGLILTLAAPSLLPTPAQAQQAATREQEQVRRLRQQLQQLQQEQAAAQQAAQKQAAENSALAAQVRAAQAAAGRARASVAAGSQALAALQAEVAALKTERAALQADLGRAQTALADTGARLDRSSTELSSTRARLAASETAFAGLRRERVMVGEQLDKCSANNAELVRVGQELLGRYGNFGLGERVAAREPFLQFKRVQLENLAQDYRGRIEDQRFAPQGLPVQPVSPAPQSMAPASPPLPPTAPR